MILNNKEKIFFLTNMLIVNKKAALNLSGFFYAFVSVAWLNEFRKLFPADFVI